LKKNRIKSDICPNCQTKLSASDNFCPNCGQENDNKRQSFSRVMSDLITGFLSVDSRFTNSIPALLFKPGFLTTQFIDGKRNRYLNPVRMFITIVVIYFLFASTGETVSVNDNRNSTAVVIDSALSASAQTASASPDSIRPNEDQPEFEIGAEDYPRIRELVKAGVKDTDAVLDSIGEEKTFWNRFWYSEMIKFAASDFDEFKKYLYSKLPWVIFMLMPVFALLLKLFYIRNRILYIDHLIFAFHLHSFVFLTGWFYLLITEYIGANVDLILFWIIVIYTVAALKKVYNQSWLKTMVKLLLLSTVYFIAGLLSLVLSMFVIFLIW
jgi:hypothetical protein